MSMRNEKKTLMFGADYNPDQWTPDVWREDIKLMKLLGVNTVSIPILSWSQIETSEGVFDFSWLDEVMDLLNENGIQVVMATPSFAQPAWLSEKYPDVLPVGISGMRRKHGARGNFCPNNADFRRLSRRMAETLARRYGDKDVLALWHVNNEYGPACWCDNCKKNFHEWLERKYKTIEELNRRWNTAFWSHRYNNFDQIETPSYLNEVVPGGLVDRDASFNQPISIDYQEFQSDSIRDCYRNEAEVLREITPEIPVTTNIPCGFKQINWYSWENDIDVAAWDNYPSNAEMQSPHSLAIMAMKHDIVRGIKRGQSFLLMEQTPSQQNWLAYNIQKRPGEMARWSWQAIAHGSDAVMFFQFRQSRSGFEKFHAALVPHAGHINDRVAQEVRQLGLEMSALGDSIVGSKIEARIGFIIDWRNWWAAELSSGPTVALKYQDQILLWYQWFWNHNIAVDFIRPEQDLSRYSVVVAPMLYMADEHVTRNIESYVSAGGRFLATYFSGIVNSDDSVYLGGTPGAFRKVLGLRVEETDAMAPPACNIMAFPGEGINENHACATVFDICKLEGAEALALYSKEYYRETPCFTKNEFGTGYAYYVASVPCETLLSRILEEVMPADSFFRWFEPFQGIEVTIREASEYCFLFCINHSITDRAVELPFDNGFEVLTGQNTGSNMIFPANTTRILRLEKGNLPWLNSKQR